MENRNDADILGVRRGCTFVGYSNANFDSSAGNFVLTSGATDRWQTKKDTMTMSAFHPDGLCLPCHRSLSCSTRQSSRTSASADRILGVTALTLGWDESLGETNFVESDINMYFIESYLCHFHICYPLKHITFCDKTWSADTHIWRHHSSVLDLKRTSWTSKRQIPSVKQS